MQRIVQPEILDSLPPEDPAALHSRRDLQRINRLMDHGQLFQQALAPEVAPRRWVDLGSGDGTLVARIAEAMNWPGGELILVDQQPALAPGTLDRLVQKQWQVRLVCENVFHWLEQKPAGIDLITTNLFLHHFPDDTLIRLLQGVSHATRAFVALEPRRSTLPFLASHLLGFIGCNHVTRHDAVVSVRAGFRDHELTRLWPQKAGWVFSEKSTGLFSHQFLAKRA